jgi:Flp pilus assembly protein TadB
MTLPARWPQQVIAILLIVAAGLFVLGVTAEDDHDTHSDEPTAEAADAGEHNEATGSAETIEAEAAERSATAAEAAQEADEDEERVLGIDVESPVLVTAAVVVSVLLAGLVWLRPNRRLLIVIAVVAAGFAVLGAAEVAHQLDEDRPALALLGGVIGALHASAAALAIHQATTAAAAHAPPHASMAVMNGR